MDSFVAGATAGLVVDLVLYPLDTIKTRIQSKDGFWRAGGFCRIYNGISAVAVGSVPGGAAFFLVYDEVKRRLLSVCRTDIEERHRDTTSHIGYGGIVACQALAAICGESVACCIRVPVEMVKQRMQAGQYHSVITALRCITNDLPPVDNAMWPHGQARVQRRIRLMGLSHLFTGMPIMLMREWPFSVIQMSIYEWSKYRVDHSVYMHQYYNTLLPVCGAFSGGFAAFVTTPFDVLKTRIMLQRRSVRGIARILDAVSEIAREPGRPGDRFGIAQRYFRGATTRVLWIALGGSIFFSTYEVMMRIATSRHRTSDV